LFTMTQVLFLQSVGVLRGTGAAWKGGPPGRVGEQSSISLGCTAAERTSVFAGTHHPSRGDAGVGGLSDGAPRVRAKRFIRCGHNAQEVPPPVAALARRMGCAVPGSRRGFARPNDGANLHSTGSGPRGDASSEAPLRGSSAPLVPARGRTKAKAGRGSLLFFAERGHEAARGRCPCLVVSAEVGRTPSGSKKRATGSELVESQVEPKERVNGSLTGDVTRTRKRSGAPPARRGRSSGERRSSSRERRASEGGYVGSFALRRGRVVRSIYRWKTSRVGKAHAFHEAPAEPVLAASGPTLGAR
jgi:hypothetical protein